VTDEATWTIALQSSAPTGLKDTPGCAQVVLRWNKYTGASGYNVKRSTTSGGPYTTIKTGCTTTNYTDTTVVNGSVYYYVVSAVKNGVETDNSAQVSAFPSAGLLSPWLTKDIGTVGDVGGASYSNSKFNVAGSGADIWNTEDGFRYVYQTASGDCTVVARIVSMSNTDPWAKAGVMIRETLASNSKHASTFVTKGNGVAFQNRIDTGGASANVNTTGLAAPYWVKVKRVGSTFTSYSSPNGTTWTVLGSQTITMGANVYIGLAVTSHNDGDLCTAVFSNVTATP
jgi:hypothetical protein